MVHHSLSLFLLLPFRINYCFFFHYLFIYFWLCWAFVAVWAFSNCGDLGLFLVAVQGLLIVMTSLVGPVVVAHGLSAPRSVESSCTKNQTPVSCLGRQILFHCGNREVFPLFPLETS